MSPCREAGTPSWWWCTNHRDTIDLFQSTISTINVFVCWRDCSSCVNTACYPGIFSYIQKQQTSFCAVPCFPCALSHHMCKLGYLKQDLKQGFNSSPLLTDYNAKCLKQAKGQVFYILLTAHLILDLSEQFSKHQGSIGAPCTQALNSVHGLNSMVVILLTSHLVTRNRLTIFDHFSLANASLSSGMPLSTEARGEPLLDGGAMPGSIPLLTSSH